jgi:uncharacterized protein (TIGR00252 family)
MTLRAWLQERVTPPTLGERGERAAAKLLRRLGYQIITTRRRHRYGEVDVIAVDDQTVVFVEVKTRRSDQHGRPAEAVDATRQARLTRAACWNTPLVSTSLRSSGPPTPVAPRSTTSAMPLPLSVAGNSIAKRRYSLVLT